MALELLAPFLTAGNIFVLPVSGAEQRSQALHVVRKPSILLFRFRRRFHLRRWPYSRERRLPSKIGEVLKLDV